MTPGELHAALREVVAIGRRGGYDNDEIAENLGRVVRDYAATELRAAADWIPGPEEWHNGSEAYDELQRRAAILAPEDAT